MIGVGQQITLIIDQLDERRTGDNQGEGGPLRGGGGQHVCLTYGTHFVCNFELTESIFDILKF